MNMWFKHVDENATEALRSNVLSGVRDRSRWPRRAEREREREQEQGGGAEWWRPGKDGGNAEGRGEGVVSDWLSQMRKQKERRSLTVLVLSAPAWSRTLLQNEPQPEEELRGAARSGAHPARLLPLSSPTFFRPVLNPAPRPLIQQTKSVKKASPALLLCLAIISQTKARMKVCFDVLPLIHLSLPKRSWTSKVWS